MAKKYVCAVKYFPNCRVHDGATSTSLQFFSNAEDLKRNLALTYGDSEYGDIYLCSTGEKIASVSYEFSRHEFRKLELNRQGFLQPEDDFEGCVLVDDGYGKKVWKTWEQYRERL